MSGSGQTAWMQGVAYGVVMDSLVNDYVSAVIPINHAIRRELRNVLRQVTKTEGGRAEVFQDKDGGGQQFLQVVAPQFMIPYIRDAVAAMRSAVSPPASPPSVPPAAMRPKLSLAVPASNSSDTYDQNPESSKAPSPATCR